MKDIVYIEGLGQCRVVTKNRVNQDGINEPYDIYEPIKEVEKQIIKLRKQLLKSIITKNHRLEFLLKSKIKDLQSNNY